MEPKINTPIPNIDPAQMRANAIAKEHKERFEKISQRLLDVVVEEGVTVVELPVIIGMLTAKVNMKIDGAKIEQILKLNGNAK